MKTLNQRLQDIIAQPDDDQLRLDYAQHISDLDPERSKFIMEQVAQDKSSTALDRFSRERRANSGIPAELLPFLKKTEWERHTHRFYRGFIEHVSVALLDFLVHSEKILACAPIRHLTLTGGESEDVMRLFTSPAMARLRSVRILDAPTTDREITALAASPHASNLRWLEIQKGNITYSGFLTVAESAFLENLGHFYPGSASKSQDVRWEYHTGWDSHLTQTDNAARLNRWYGNSWEGLDRGWVVPWITHWTNHDHDPNNPDMFDF